MELYSPATTILLCDKDFGSIKDIAHLFTNYYDLRSSTKLESLVAQYTFASPEEEEQILHPTEPPGTF